MKIVQTSPELIVRISLDPAKLGGLTYPLTIDPSVLVGASDYTFITDELPNSNFDTHPLTAVCKCNFRYRTLARPIPNLATFFKEPVDIIGATLILSRSIDSTGSQAPAGRRLRDHLRLAFQPGDLEPAPDRVQLEHRRRRLRSSRRKPSCPTSPGLPGGVSLLDPVDGQGVARRASVLNTGS